MALKVKNKTTVCDPLISYQGIQDCREVRATDVSVACFKLKNCTK
jgi:hypothetical protein